VSAGAPADPPVVAPATPSDRAAVEALLSGWLGADRVRRRRDWLERNPHGAPLVWVGLEDGGRGDLVATTSLFPRRFVVEGKDVVGAIGGDAFVRPDRRRGGLAKALHEATRRATAEPGGVSFMFGPPVPGNLGALVAAGARVVGHLRHYRRPAGLLGGPALERVLAPGPELDRLWERARGTHRVAGVRDAAFVRWRFLEAPSPAEVHALRGDDGALRGWVATTRLRSRLVVLDLLAAAPEDAVALARGALRLARETGCAQVGTRLNPRTTYARALERVGFLRGRSRPFFQVLSRGGLSGLDDPREWHLTYGDEDVDDLASFLAPAPAGAPRRRARRTRRACLLIDGYESTGAGTEGQIETLLARLPRGWEAELWTLRPSRFLRGRAFPARTRALDVRSLGSPATLARLPTLARRLRAARFDVVQAFQFDACALAPVLGRLARVPVLVSRRDLGFWQTPRHLEVLRRADRLAAGVVGNCRAVADRVAEREDVPRPLVLVVENGHDPARFEVAPDAGLRRRLSVPDGVPLVGVVANLKPVKRQADLLEAVAALRGRARGAHVVLVGVGDARPLLDRAARLGLAGRVHVVPSPGGAVPVVRALDVGVLCSESEGLSNAVLEYMACGLPVVASAVGGNPDLVADGVNGRLFPAGDVGALARALESVLADPERARAMGRAGRARFEARFTADRMARETVRTWERAVADRGAASPWRFEPDAAAAGALVVRGTGPAGARAALAWADAGGGRLVATPAGLPDRDLLDADAGLADAARAALLATARTPWRRLVVEGAPRDGALRCALRALAWSLPYAERASPGARGRFDVSVFRPTRAGRAACLLAGAAGFLRDAAAPRRPRAAPGRGEPAAVPTPP
jgi:glycosyltransferase involved in cell wall biosynthesis